MTRSSHEDGGGVVVANSGSLRWMGEMAAGLAEAGLLERYVTTLDGTAELERRLAALPGRIGSVVAGQVRLRRLPAEVDPADAARVATASYLALTAIHRVTPSPSVVHAASSVHHAVFDRAAARRLTAGTGAVIAPSKSASRTLKRAARLGVRGVLDYPIAHHDVVDKLLSEEARREPNFADTIQYLAPSGRARRLLDDEIARADHILLLSSFSRQSFVDAGVPTEKLEVAPLGVDLDMFSPAQRDPQSPFRVLFAGQISQRKGISYLLEGFRRAELSDAELVFLGRPVGPATAWISQPRVVHWPAVGIYDLRDLYVACDVYVLPSLAEGFPQTAIIAMACGLPPIVSEHTFGADVVTDGVDGFVVPIRSPDMIADRLRTLAEDPELRCRMGAAARRTAERFTWANYRTQIAQLARRVMTAA